MIREDEFTNSKSNNDSFISKSEYGNTQDSEYSDSGEMNLHKAAYDASLMKSQNTTKMVEDVTQGTSTAIETTVASSANAGAIAAGSVTAVVAASTVAVTALGVLTGLSVALHNYEVTLNSFIISSNQLNYNVTIIDKGMDDDGYEHWSDQNPDEEKLPFVMRIFNDDYDASQELFYFEQSGTFSNLTLGQRYNIVISENKFNGQVLYEDHFITYVNSTFLNFELHEWCDLKEDILYYDMNLIDEKDILSDYKLTFYHPDAPEKIVASFDLPEETGYQSLSISGPNGALLDLTKECGYRFSYIQDGKEIEYKKGIINFYDLSYREAKFNALEFDRTFSYKEGTMDLRLDYVDDLGWYDNFIFTLTAHYFEGDATTGDGQEYTDDYEIYLDATTETQTINVLEYEVNLDTEYTYKLTCNYRGAQTTLEEETTKFKFTDNSGATSTDPADFNFIFNKTANFLTDSFEVQFDYVDDFYYYYGFTLNLLPNGVNAEYAFDLTETTDVQTCTFNEQDHWNYSLDYEYSYVLSCYYQGELITLERSDELFTFTDISGAVTAWDSLSFDGTYSFPTGMAKLTLNYTDDFGYYSNFVFTLINFDDEDDYREFELEATTEEQEIDLYGADIDLNETWWKYKLTVNHAKQGTIILEESGENEEFMWSDPYSVTDPDSVSVTFVNNEANFVDRTLWVQLDYRDDYDRYGDFVLTLFGRGSDDEEDFINRVDFELQKTKEPQQITVDGIDEDTGNYFVDITKYKVGYGLYWWESSWDDGTDHWLFGDEDSYEEITLKNSAKTVFNGVTSKYQAYQSTYAGSGEEGCFMYMKFDYTDENNMWSNFKAYWVGVNPDNGSTYRDVDIDLMYDREFYGWHRVSITSESLSDGDEFEDMPIFDGNGHDLVIVADINNPYTGETAVDQEIYRVEGTHPTFGGADREIFKATFTEIGAYEETYSMTVMDILYHNSDFGEYDYYVNVSFIFEDEESGDTYTYTLTGFSDYIFITFDEFDGGEVDPWDWDGKEFTVTIHYSVTSDPDNPDATITGPYDVVVATHHKFAISVQ